jgi:putative colanic acid biosynthesis acetyltransferase WcaF
MNKIVNLSKFDNTWYKPRAGKLKQFLWYFTNALIFKSALFPISGLKVWLLKIFGAGVGKGINIKPSVSIKYPWRLTIGDYTWIGENVWIDNLDDITIGSNVCISQGAMLLCGNHDYKKSSFNLMTGKIIIEDGAWIGAKSTVCPGVTCRSHAVLTAGSVANKDLEPYGIYRGNPAVKEKERKIER